MKTCYQFYVIFQGCMKTCYQFYVISECGCADSYYPKEGAAFPDVTHSCDPTNIVEGDHFLSCPFYIYCDR